jgi:transcriptional regulator with XRE-family HTH domain
MVAADARLHGSGQGHGVGEERGSVMATLVLRKDKLAAYRRLAGLESNVSLAGRLGVDPTTVYRVLTGRTMMSARFIAGIVEVFGAELFADLFEVVSAAAPVEEAAS